MRLHHTRLGKGLIATAALATALTFSACSSGDSDSDAKTTIGGSAGATAASSGTTAGAALPSRDDVTRMFATLMDPSIPTAQKVDLVQNGAQGAALFEQIARGAQDLRAQVTVTGQPTSGPNGTAMVPWAVTLNGQAHQQGPMVLVNEGGRWKVEQQYACGLIRVVMPDQVPAACHG